MYAFTGKGKTKKLTEADALDVLAGITPWTLASGIDSSNTELIFLVLCEVDDTIGCVLHHGMRGSAPSQVAHYPLLHNVALDVSTTIVSWLCPLDGDGVLGRFQTTWSSRGTRRI